MMKKIILNLLMVIGMSAPTFAQQKVDEAAYRTEFAKLVVLSEMETTTLGQMMGLLKLQLGAALTPEKQTNTSNDLKKEFVPLTVEEVRSIYQKYYTVEDIKALNAFYATSTGKKMAQLSNQIGLEAQQAAVKYNHIANTVVMRYFSK